MPKQHHGQHGQHGQHGPEPLTTGASASAPPLPRTRATPASSSHKTEPTEQPEAAPNVSRQTNPRKKRGGAAKQPHVTLTDSSAIIAVHATAGRVTLEMSGITLRPGAELGKRKPRLHDVLESVVQDKAQFELLLTLVSAFVNDDTKPASQRQLLSSKLQSIRSLYDAAHCKLGLVVYDPPASPPLEHGEHRERRERREYREIILQIGSAADFDVHGKAFSPFGFLDFGPLLFHFFGPPASLQALACCSSPTAMTTTAMLTLRPEQKQRTQALQAIQARPSPSPIQTKTKTTISIETFANKIGTSGTSSATVAPSSALQLPKSQCQCRKSSMSSTSTNAGPSTSSLPP
jgi:hypothetical protein